METLDHKKCCSGLPSLGTNKTRVGHWRMTSIKVERKINTLREERNVTSHSMNENIISEYVLLVHPDWTREFILANTIH